MKKKKIVILLALCLLCMMSVLPTAAKSKSAPQKLFLNREKIQLYVGESKKMAVQKAKPANASIKVTWKSKNKRVANVSERGMITAKKPGRTIITAVSKKNPSVKASIKVTVKKSPTKKEKKDIPTRIYDLPSDVAPLWTAYAQFSGSWVPGRKGLNKNVNVLIIRSDEGFKEIKKAWNKLLYLPFHKTGLASFENMNFSKYSLVLLHHPFGYVSIFPDGFLSTRFDESGNLQGVLKPNTEKNISDDSIVLGIIPKHYIAVLIEKSDEAMIDSFYVWGEVYDKIGVCP